MADFRPYAIRGETRPAAVRAGRSALCACVGETPSRSSPATATGRSPHSLRTAAPRACWACTVCPRAAREDAPPTRHGASSASASPGCLRTREGPLCRGVEARRADAPLRQGPPHRVSGPAATEPPAPPPGRAVALLRTCSAAHSVWLFKVTLNLKGIKSTFSGQTRNVPLVTENSVGPMGDVGAREAVMGVCLLRPVTE